MESKLSRDIYLMSNPVNLRSPWSRPIEQPKVQPPLLSQDFPRTASFPQEPANQQNMNENQKANKNAEENLLERLIDQLNQCELKAAKKKSLNIMSAKNGFIGQKQGLQPFIGNTDPEIQSQSQIPAKTLIVAIIKELCYIYNKIPQEGQIAELESIAKSNEQIFLQVIKNKMQLNSVLQL